MIMSESLLIQTIMINNQDTIYFKDLESHYILNSRAHAMQFGLKDASLMKGKTDFDFFPRNFAIRARKEELEIINTREPIINNIERWEQEDGSCIWFSACKYPLIDQEGRIVGTWGTSRDITELKRAEERLAKANEELKKLSVLDELSGLYNRRYFYEMLGRAIHKYKAAQAGGRHETFSIIVLDIDRFKSINDSLGHSIGDEAIRHLAEVLRKTCRPNDTAFRVGGDEFTIILHDTDLQNARKQAERVRIAAEGSPLHMDGRDFPMTLSIGVASFDEHDNGKEFIHTADSRLYRSKSLGRNRVT
jgi:diguanylate cyclase (GGDEF)-like protein/PAS domain S-box-containing protein